jgi:hypothetical protein
MVSSQCAVFDIYYPNVAYYGPTLLKACYGKHHGDAGLQIR